MRDPISLALFGDEQVEWRASPNWDLAGISASAQSALSFDALPHIHHQSSVRCVGGRKPVPQRRISRSPDGDGCNAHCLYHHGLCLASLGSAIFQPSGQPCLLSKGASTRSQTKKLIVIPEDQSLLAIKAADYQLTSASVRPNGLVNDLELFFRAPRHHKKRQAIARTGFTPCDRQCRDHKRNHRKTIF